MKSTCKIMLVSAVVSSFVWQLFPAEAREITFPKNSIGKLSYFARGTNLPQVHLPFAAAQGRVKVDDSKKLELEVSAEAVKDPDFWKTPALDEIYFLDFSRSNIDDAFMEKIRPLKNMFCLRLEGTQITDKSIQTIGKKELKLSWLWLQRTQVHGSNFGLLNKTGVRKISAGNDQLDEKALGELSKIRSLTSLGLEYADLRYLTKKRLNPDEYDQAAAPDFAKLAALQNIEDITLSGLSIGSRSFAVLAKLPKLNHLRASSTNFSTDDLRFLNEKTLERINVSSCTKIDDRAAEKLSRFKKLRFVVASRTKMTLKGAECLARLNLLRLELLGIKLNGSDLAFLKTQHKLENLDLQNTGINDKAMPAISSLKSLKALIISDNHITDTSIANLSALTNLAVLDISGTDISEKGFQLLKSKLPTCKVIWG